MADMSFDDIKDNIAFKHIPLLTLDERWYQLVPEKHKTDRIRILEKKVNSLLKRQGQVNNDIKDIKKLKAQIIKGVVEHMESDESDTKHEKRMSSSQRLIYEAKDKIARLENESDEMPRLLMEANQELLFETVSFCYTKINDNIEDIELLDKWINETRLKLKKNILIKQDKEISNDQTYSYMHNILGPELMGVLDRMNEQ